MNLKTLSQSRLTLGLFSFTGFVAAPMAAATPTLDEFVVTSQKREQAIQDVPLTVTAFNGDFLNAIGVQEFDELANFVPGLEIQLQSPNNPGFVIRGITSDSGDSRIEPRVSIFQDGVSISKSRGSVVELFDLERVEVLKGPQGTLFGRGAQIGAVHLIQNKAQNETSREISFGLGNFNERYLRGHVNAPIVEDTLFFRVAGILNTRDGFLENLAGGTLQGKETYALRGLLRYEPSERTTVDFILNYQRDTPPGTSFKSQLYAPRGGDSSPFTFSEMEQGDNLYIDRTVWGATLLWDQVLTDNWSLSSITAFRQFISFENFDADGTAAPVLFFAEDAEGEQFSQEFRFNYDAGGRLRGFAGINIHYENGFQEVPFRTDERSLFVLFSPLLAQFGLPVQPLPLILPDGSPNLFVTNNPLTGQPFKTGHEETYVNRGRTTAFEVFADATYDLTERLSLTAGLRGTYEDVFAAYEVFNSATPGSLGLVTGAVPNNLFAPTNGRITGEDSFTSAVGRLILNFQLDSDNNTYLGVSRGRRPNVINVTASGPNTLKDEIVWSMEFGVKGLLWERRLQYDLGVFRYDYSNFQTSVTELTPGGVVAETRDSGNASAFGFEAGIRTALTANLTAFGSYAYIDATFDDKDADNNPQELAGNRFRLTPRHSAALGLDWVLPADNLGNFYVTPTFTYKSQVFFEEDNEPGIEQEGYGLVNIRAGLIRPGGRWNFQIYCTNLLDKEYLIDAGNTGATFGIPTFIAGNPRFFGFRITANF